MNKKKTCGPMYREAIERYGTTPEAYRAFAAGFISGQAEKVYLGACVAAMFRPSPERAAMVQEILDDVTMRYALTWMLIEDEFWICRGGNECFIETLNNPYQRHAYRGWLCGVPFTEIDAKFHERVGYRQPCDRVEP